MNHSISAASVVEVMVSFYNPLIASLIPILMSILTEALVCLTACSRAACSTILDPPLVLVSVPPLLFVLVFLSTL